MGYTHYWEQPVGKTIDNETWSKLCYEAQNIIEAANNDGIKLGDWDGEPGKPIVNSREIRFNGLGAEAHETFHLARKVKAPEWRPDDTNSFNFCKTAYKPYDAVVVSILAAAKELLGDKIKVSSDGGDEAIKRVY